MCKTNKKRDKYVCGVGKDDVCANCTVISSEICGMLRKNGFYRKMLGIWVDKKREVGYNFKYKSACNVCAFCVNYA